MRLQVEKGKSEIMCEEKKEGWGLHLFNTMSGLITVNRNFLGLDQHFGIKEFKV